MDSESEAFAYYPKNPQQQLRLLVPPGSLQYQERFENSKTGVHIKSIGAPKGRNLSSGNPFFLKLYAKLNYKSKDSRKDHKKRSPDHHGRKPGRKPRKQAK